jgi:CheY-like chemotaxis protein
MARTTTPSPKLLRALALDADAGSLAALTRSLEARCCSVVTASDGARGLDLLLEELLTLDVLVVDAALPHRDGRAFAELVRRAGGERELALVVVARDAEPGLRASLLALGVDAVVDRREGPAAVADAAIAAIVARGARALEADAEAEPSAAPARAPEAPEAPLRFAFAGGWTLLTA